MLSRAGFGDDPLLAEALRDEGLAERVIDLVGSGMREILALQPDVVPQLFGETQRVGDRRRAADEVPEKISELRAESGVVAEVRPRVGELVECRDQHLGNVASTVGPEAAALVG